MILSSPQGEIGRVRSGGRFDGDITVHVIGLRGIPEVQGGIERHCQMLYPRLAALGIRANLYARSGYVPDKPYEYKGTRVIPLASIRSRSLETITHTGMSILHAKREGAKFLHMHAIGPAVWTPFAKRLGFQVVVTHHGFDYRRQKWGNKAQAVLRRGEDLAIRHADGIICISREIRDHMRERGARGRLALIPNGVERPEGVPESRILRKWKLEPGRYFLITARFVAEKGIPDLIEGWGLSGLRDRFALAVVGGEDHPSVVGCEIRELAERTGATLTGILGGECLQSLYAHSRGFVLPSFHEGLPISLLEAMSWNLPVAASSIEANLEVGLGTDCYFRPGHPDEIAAQLRRIADGPERVDHCAIMKDYDWDRIAKRTAEFYREVVGQGAS